MAPIKKAVKKSAPTKPAPVKKHESLVEKVINIASADYENSNNKQALSNEVKDTLATLEDLSLSIRADKIVSIIGATASVSEVQEIFEEVQVTIRRNIEDQIRKSRQKTAKLERNLGY